MLRQTRQPMSVFLIPVNQSKQLWHHSTPEYIWHHLPKMTKTCQTGYTHHDRHKIKIEHDIIDKPVKLDILNEIPPQVNEIPAHFIHEINTIAYDVSDVNLFPLHLNEIPPKIRIIRCAIYYLWEKLAIMILNFHLRKPNFRKTTNSDKTSDNCVVFFFQEFSIEHC